FHLLSGMDELPSPPAKLVIYPASPDVLSLFLKSQVTVGAVKSLMTGIRVRAYLRTPRRSVPPVLPWEQRLDRKKKNLKLRETDSFPVHDFFPAVHLSKNGSMCHIATREYFGRDDPLHPSIYFAQRIEDVVRVRPYDMAIISPDAIVTRTERRRFRRHA